MSANLQDKGTLASTCTTQKKQKTTTQVTNPQIHPADWDEERVQRVLAHYEAQSDDDAADEDDAAFQDLRETMMEVPLELVPAVRKLIAERRQEH